MASTPNVREHAARNPTIKRIEAYELNIEACTAEMEASRLELVAYQARAQAEEAMTEAIRLTSSRDAVSTLFDPNSEEEFVRKLALVAVQARDGVRKLVQCFAQATRTDGLEMFNEQEDSALGEVIGAVEMAVETVLPVENISLSDRFDNEEHRSDIIRNVRAILEYYSELHEPHQSEEEPCRAEEESRSEDIPIADVEDVPIARAILEYYSELLKPQQSEEEFHRAEEESTLEGIAIADAGDIFIANVENFIRANRNGNFFEETREGFNFAQNEGIPSYWNSAMRELSGSIQNEDAPLHEMRESPGSVRERENLFKRRESRGSLGGEANGLRRRTSPQSRPKCVYTLQEAIEQANLARTRQARQNQQNMSDLS